MGGNLAKNVVDDGVTIAVNSITQATQLCQTAFTESQIISISGNNNENINIGSINASEVILVNIDCTQTDTAQNSIDNNVSQTISQIAKAVSQAFQMPKGSQQAINNTRLWTRMGTTIQNVFNQTCKTSLSAVQGIKIDDNTNGTVNIASLNFNEQINGLVDCIQNNVTVTDIKNLLVQNIEQKATAVVEGILGPLIFIFIVIILLVFLFLFQTVGNWQFILVIAFVVVLYLAIAYFASWWPFNKSTDTN